MPLVAHPALKEAEEGMRFMRLKELRQRVGLSRTSIWHLERKAQFPPRRQLSDNAVAWLEDEVDRWVRARDSVTSLRGGPDVPRGALEPPPGPRASRPQPRLWSARAENHCGSVARGLRRDRSIS